ncbi:MAG: nitroreductase family protein [Paludibacter sp.]|nr:nitroreductase family protein [Paludibacter sp.]
MDFLDLVANRESIRDYDSEKLIPEQILFKILEAGRLAPSACNLQPWKFVVVSSRQKLEEVRTTYSRSWFAEAPHILIVVGNSTQSWVRSDGYNSIETDLAIAMDHIILAAESLSVGTCWVGNFDYAALKKVLNLDKDEVVFAMTPLGYTKSGFRKKGQKSRKKMAEIVHFI